MHQFFSRLFTENLRFTALHCHLTAYTDEGDTYLPRGLCISQQITPPTPTPPPPERFFYVQLTFQMMGLFFPSCLYFYISSGFFVFSVQKLLFRYMRRNANLWRSLSSGFPPLCLFSQQWLKGVNEAAEFWKSGVNNTAKLFFSGDFSDLKGQISRRIR